jgi:exo-beta-1,3-glucanase (GH17 family)
MRAVVAVLLLVTAAHAALWGILQDKQQAPDFHGMLPSASYTPFEPGHTVDVAADSEKIRADLKQFSTITRAVRLYSSTEGNELVPPIAAELGMKVMVGAWIDKDGNRNNRDIDAAINLARKNSNVIGIVVGNETIFRGDQIPIENLGPQTDIPPDPAETTRILHEESQRLEDAKAQPADKRAEAEKWAVAENNVHRLIKVIQRVRKSVNGIPVTTGEIYSVWSEHPELASNVDFIGAHVLP